MKNELRIGNLVSLSLLDGSLEKEVFINEAQLIGIIKGEFLVKPVPITEDKLIKFGFKNQEEQWYTLRVGVCMFAIMSYDGIKWIYISGLGTVIEHVHQLQNLFYSLTSGDLAPAAPSINPDIAQAIEK